MKHVLLFALVCACSSAAPAPVGKPVAPAPAAPGVIVRGDIVRPPFMAADLRRAMPVGTEIRLKVAQAGKPTVVQHWRVTAADDTACTIHTIIYAEDGTTQLEDQGTQVAAWAELEKHAEFPAALTTYKDATVEVAAGKFDTWLFEIKPADADEPARRMHFARNLPGPPVWMEMTKDGAVVLKLELVSRK